MKRYGFTITELLMVIAAISLLIGLLAPALSSVGAASRASHCQSNLRQLAVAAQRYTTIYDANPAALRFESNNGVLHRIAWDWITTISNQYVGPGPLWAMTDHPGQVHQCPDCHESATYSGDPFTGYNYNTSFIGAEASFGQLGWNGIRKGVPLHQCRRASQCAMFGDGGWKSGANKFMRAPMNQEGFLLSTIYAGGQAFRHDARAQIAFIDGHIAATNKPFQGALATPNLLSQTMSFPNNGFLSQEDQAYDPR
jgi:prepilin-type N-terminal cleavage/methylation domain-containing protein/prepilin-type processing-associated H-X9-DG protein